MARTLSVKMARAIAAEINGLDRLFVDIAEYLPQVKAELKDLSALPEKYGNSWVATRALLFALSSPQNLFDNNVIAARRLHAGLQGFETVEDVYQALAADRLGTVTSGSVARSIFHSLDYIRNLSHFDAVALRRARDNGQLFGNGPKVTAMAAHLYSETDAVFTLDVHMLRGIVETVLGIRDTWTIGTSAYKILEDALLGWARSRYSGETPFAVQWAMWSVFRGQFDSHMAIFS
jgi:hypothetical protein